MRVLQGALLFLFIYGCVAPPVDEKRKKKDKEHLEDNEIDQGFEVEYKRYLQEVVNVLESDDDFRQRLLKADPEDIKSGKISNELEFVNHNVRTKLDELKRQEMERLRHAAIRHYEETNGIDKKHMKMPTHLDHSNPHSFEPEDLKKLILQTTKELEEVDRQRKDEFKEYEMKKELEYQEQLNHMDDKNRVEAEKFHKQQAEKHRQHQPIHHPGSKQQLEQVWEEQDHLSPEDFNPKTFFKLHDLDGNGVWDANEVKALFKKELDKLYDPNAPEDDIRERQEEMERMREHVFNETDTDRDKLISYQEFLDQTKRQEFERDEGWDPIDPQTHPVYNEDEYKQYAKQHEEEIRRMMDQGLIPRAPPGYVPMVLPPGAQVPPGYDVYGQGHHGQGYHPQQGGHPQQGHPQQGHHGLPPPHQQGHPQQGHHGLPPPHQQGHPQQGHLPPHHQQGHPQQGQLGYQQPHPQQGHIQAHPQQGHPQQQGHISQDHSQQGHPPPHHQQQGHPQQQAYHIPPNAAPGHPGQLQYQHDQGQGGQYPQDPQYNQQQPQGNAQYNHPNSPPVQHVPPHQIDNQHNQNNQAQQIPQQPHHQAAQIQSNPPPPAQNAGGNPNTHQQGPPPPAPPVVNSQPQGAH